MGLGYAFAGGEWKAPAGIVASLVPGADAMHGCVIRRADDLAGCTENSPEEQELEAIVDAIETYEAKCSPEGKCGPQYERCWTWLSTPAPRYWTAPQNSF